MKYLLLVTFVVILFSCQEARKRGETKSTAVQVEQEATVTIPDTAQSQLIKINNELRDNVNDQELYIERARIYNDLGDYESAIADIQRALMIDSTSIEAYIALSTIYSDQGELGKVKETLERALKIMPGNSDLHVKLGELFLYAKNNKKSLEEADLAIKYNIYNADAYYLKGFNFLEMGDTSKAISSFQTAVEQDPSFIDAYLQLGLIYTMKDDPLALDYIQNVLELDSAHKEALYTYAMYAQQHQMYNEAIQSYVKLTKLYPDFREAYYNLGYIHMYYLELYRQATFHFTDAIEVDPDYFQAYYNRGYSYELMGDIRNAAQDYKKALSIKPDYGLAAKGLSRVKELANMDI